MRLGSTCSSVHRIQAKTGEGMKMEKVRWGVGCQGRRKRYFSAKREGYRGWGDVILGVGWVVREGALFSGARVSRASTSSSYNNTRMLAMNDGRMTNPRSSDHV